MRPPHPALNELTIVVLLQPAHHYSYGLHQRCSSLTDTCESFPQSEDCHGDDRYFCSMWRSVGFLMSFAVVLEGMSIVAYGIILGGGKRLRENGWRILSLLIILSAIVQAAGMSIVVGPLRSEGNDPDDRVLYCDTDGSGLFAGIPLRQRRPVLRWLASGPVLDLLHCQLVLQSDLRGRDRDRGSDFAI